MSEDEGSYSIGETGAVLDRGNEAVLVFREGRSFLLGPGET